jgi:hypothetical protein
MAGLAPSMQLKTSVAGLDPAIQPQRVHAANNVS